MNTIRVDDAAYQTIDWEGPLDFPGQEIECPECREWHAADRWAAYDTYCESCGGHPILSCPKNHYFDPYGGDGGTTLNMRYIHETSESDSSL
uniref:DNA-directed RNA polymerase n=1 Tax=Myoviridae sp. ctu2j3 TaxID=2825197 RepID=A0A8S5UIP9_9CAUD|nr:MAG TPA: DNA-directed RNA polymerase [Myoviridae sp. ctu2j3]DAF94307.1 MAG TPA: DNA-directed RNA polymerase [Myoviridae sp. ctu2j3]